MIETLRHGPTSEVARTLDQLETWGPAELRAALVNALERIDAMEQKWAELETAMEQFNKEWDARRPGDGAIASDDTP